jgi:hypothetical protein
MTDIHAPPQNIFSQQLSEKTMLKGIFGPQRDERPDGWMNNTAKRRVLTILYSSPYYDGN